MSSFPDCGQLYYETSRSEQEPLTSCVAENGYSAAHEVSGSAIYRPFIMDPF